MRILFITNVTEPKDQAGKTGETKDVPERIANILVKGGYAVIAKEKKHEPDERVNTKRRRSENGKS